MYSTVTVIIFFVLGVLLGASMIGIIESIREKDGQRIKAYLFAFSLFILSISCWYFLV